MADIALALLPALIVGIVQLSLGGLAADMRAKLLGLFTGGLVCSLAAIPLLHPVWSWRTTLIGLVSGALLGWGLRDQTACMRTIGVSRTIPISTAAQLVTISLGGVVLMGEWRAPGALPAGACAIALLVVGVWYTSRTEVLAEVAAEEGGDPGPGLDQPGRVDWVRGTRLLVTSTIGLSGFLLVAQVAGLAGQDAIVPQAVGWTVAGLVLTSRLVAGQEADSYGPLLGKPFAQHAVVGVLWGMANLITQVASDRVGVATAFPLSQLCAVISTIGGIILLGETRTRRELRWTATGMVLILAGAVLIGVAKALDAA